MCVHHALASSAVGTCPAKGLGAPGGSGRRGGVLGEPLPSEACTCYLHHRRGHGSSMLPPGGGQAHCFPAVLDEHITHTCTVSHTCVHTTHRHTQGLIYTKIHLYSHRHTYKYIERYTHRTYVHTYTETYTLTENIYRHTRKHLHGHRHTQTHIRTHTH